MVHDVSPNPDLTRMSGFCRRVVRLWFDAFLSDRPERFRRSGRGAVVGCADAQARVQHPAPQRHRAGGVLPLLEGRARAARAIGRRGPRHPALRAEPHDRHADQRRTAGEPQHRAALRRRRRALVGLGRRLRRAAGRPGRPGGVGRAARGRAPVHRPRGHQHLPHRGARDHPLAGGALGRRASAASARRVGVVRRGGLARSAGGAGAPLARRARAGATPAPASSRWRGGHGRRAAAGRAVGAGGLAPPPGRAVGAQRLRRRGRAVRHAPRTGRPSAPTRSTGATATDWEDMAVGPRTGRDRRRTSTSGTSATTAAARSSVTVYRVPEPDDAPSPPGVAAHRGGGDRADSTRADRPTRRRSSSTPAPAISSSSPRASSAPSRVLQREAASLVAGRARRAGRRGATIDPPAAGAGLGLPGTAVTGGDVSPDGSHRRAPHLPLGAGLPARRRPVARRGAARRSRASARRRRSSRARRSPSPATAPPTSPPARAPTCRSTASPLGRAAATTSTTTTTRRTATTSRRT